MARSNIFSSSGAGRFRSTVWAVVQLELPVFVTHPGRPGGQLLLPTPTSLRVRISGTSTQPVHNGDCRLQLLNLPEPPATRAAPVPRRTNQAAETRSVTYVPDTASFQVFSQFIFHYDDAYARRRHRCISARIHRVIVPTTQVRLRLAAQPSLWHRLPHRLKTPRGAATKLRLSATTSTSQLATPCSPDADTSSTSSNLFATSLSPTSVQEPSSASAFPPFSCEYRLPK